jgi:phosphoglycolate phosphatase-like HAD superfamily hydrolase
LTRTPGYRFTFRSVRVGELARRTGVTIRALRYYEAAGLVVPARLPNGYRDYEPDAVYVGDTAVDLQCAEAANASGIHAAWGSVNGIAPMAARIAQRRHDVVDLVRRLQTR